jgi:chemosensory pili system protein ChpB (putative protein-glutamate methylesterase)
MTLTLSPSPTTAAPHAVGARLALYSALDAHRELITRLLAELGIEIVYTNAAGGDFRAGLAQARADALLVDISNHTEADAALIEQLIVDDALPILFHDGSPGEAKIDKAWAQQIAHKLAHMAARQAPAAQAAAVTRLWVLAASLGGPEALREFLAALAPQPPAAFLVVAHTGASGFEALLLQLAAVSPLPVRRAHSGHCIVDGEVLLMPPHHAFGIDAQGCLQLSAETPDTVYSPSIEQALQTAYAGLGARLGVIFFSGLGHDGLRMSRQLHAQQIPVWAQDGASCIASAMPDGVRRAGLAGFSGSPQDLARRVNELPH